MDYRSAGNPFPFSKTLLLGDTAAIGRDERDEVAHLMARALEALNGLNRGFALRKNPRGLVATQVDIASGYLERIMKTLMTAYAQEHPGERR